MGTRDVSFLEELEHWKPGITTSGLSYTELLFEWACSGITPGNSARAEDDDGDPMLHNCIKILEDDR